jgi:hypothetical protein
MNKKIITVALMALLSILSVGCSKQDGFSLIVDGNEYRVRQNLMVYYTIDGRRGELVEIMNDAELYRFMDKMVGESYRGHVVNVTPGKQIKGGTKEKTSHTTTNRGEAVSWSTKKMREGYSVEIRYNRDTKTYTCTAVKK